MGITQEINIQINTQQCHRNRCEILGNVGDEASEDNKRRKEIDVYSTRLPITIASYINIFISKVLVSDNMKVEKGHPLCVMGSRTMEELLKDISSTAPMVIQNILNANRRSRAGIFSMEVDKIEDVQLSGMEAFDSKEAVQTRFKNFKNFDYVADLQNHHFSEQSSVADQTSPWAESIHKEWKILEKGLPETIYVRVSKLKMNLLRAAIIGPKGTAYRYGLFFVDLCFPGNYPNSPPLVHYHSHGLGINSNLDKSGAVCFNLPKTNDSEDKTWWLPDTSNVLQLLLSIQNEILNKEPVFNDRAYATMKDTSYGKISSILYNQNILVKSFKTMVYTMNKPPKDFEDFVVGHFRNHVRRILKACNTKSLSATFKNDLGSCQKYLVDAFNRIGLKNS